METKLGFTFSDFLHVYIYIPQRVLNFKAGSNLRSKNKSNKLDETALFGAGCKHEVPLKFFSLKRGEEYVRQVYI